MMMSGSILDRERLSMSKAARVVGVNVSTVWRWCLRGVNGRTLPTVIVGARRFILREDLERFIIAGDAGGEAGTPAASPRLIPGGDGAEAAARELERMGV